MARDELDSVEFIDSAGTPVPTGPAPDAGPSRTRSLPVRWLLLAGLTALVVLAGAVFVTRPTETLASLPNLQMPSGDVATSFLTDPGNLAVRYVDDELVAVSRTRLTYTERAGQGRQYVPFPTLPSAPVRFIEDDSTGHLFVVTVGTSPTRILEFSTVGAPTPKPLRDITWRASVRSAATMGGRVLLTTPEGAYSLTAGQPEPVAIPGLTGAIGDVVADPERHRFVLADLGEPAELWTFDGRRAVQQPDYIDIDNATLAVVDGQIWMAGTWKGSAVLQNLDPGRLIPRSSSSEQRRLGEQAQIVGTGTSVIWVRTAGTVNTFCIDARSGDRRSEVVSAGPMTSARGKYAVVGGGELYYARFLLGSCPG